MALRATKHMALRATKHMALRATKYMALRATKYDEKQGELRSPALARVPARQAGCLRHESLLLQDAAQFFGTEAVREGGLAQDAAGAHELGERLLHGHHAFGASDGDLAA
jgi:hypothetical protein